jgi:predicted O-methyltransferase YrrM
VVVGAAEVADVVGGAVFEVVHRGLHGIILARECFIAACDNFFVSSSNTFLPQNIYDYLVSVSVREPPLLKRLREETASHPRAMMQVPPEHGQFLALLVQLMGARRTLEIGVFTGYSSLAVALALPNDGSILACDVSEEFTSVARRYWNEAGVDHMIDLRIGPAIDTLHSLITQRQHGRFDFAFIDADKSNYEAYYECALELVRPGGLIAIDNVLWHGQVVDPAVNDEETLVLRALNKKLLGDSRVAISMVPISDGLTLCCKR